MKFTILSCLFLLLGLSACHLHHTQTGEVQHLGSSEKGTIRVRAAGYGVTKFLALENAERNAFEAVLFRGVPGSEYTKPMVSNETESRNMHSDFYRTFFEERGYKTYLLSSKTSTDFDLMKMRQKNLDAVIKINVDALRRGLEQAGVIRKFGL